MNTIARIIEEQLQQNNLVLGDNLYEKSDRKILNQVSERLKDIRLPDGTLDENALSSDEKIRMAGLLQQVNENMGVFTALLNNVQLMCSVPTVCYSVSKMIAMDFLSKANDGVYACEKAQSEFKHKEREILNHPVGRSISSANKIYNFFVENIPVNYSRTRRKKRFISDCKIY